MVPKEARLDCSRRATCLLLCELLRTHRPAAATEAEENPAPAENRHQGGRLRHLGNLEAVQGYKYVYGRWSSGGLRKADISEAIRRSGKIHRIL